jgi:hypothetical protein
VSAHNRICAHRKDWLGFGRYNAPNL